jgi:hypothetical protein
VERALHAVAPAALGRIHSNAQKCNRAQATRNLGWLCRSPKVYRSGFITFTFNMLSASAHMLIWNRDFTITTSGRETKHGYVHELASSDLVLKGIQDIFSKARQTSGLEVRLTGALGRRTKFQTFDTPQLVVHATSKTTESGSTSTAPKEVENQDEILLQKPEYTAPLQVRLVYSGSF